VVILRSDKEGAGKSIVSDTMRRLFGDIHAMTVSKPEEIVGDHNDDMDLICFVQLEEALFAGDPRTASRMRHEITGERLRINPKGRKAYGVPNRMGAIAYTGKKSRRGDAALDAVNNENRRLGWLATSDCSCNGVGSAK
jgi:hypothetical protein